MKKQEYKRCPRCDRKASFYQDKCDECGLIFARLDKVTNSAAKKAISKKEFNKVINYNVLPPDINKWKLFFIALFFGWFGAHYVKVGKYKTFIFMVSSSVLIILGGLLIPSSWFEDKYLFLIAWGTVAPASIGMIMWIVSIFRILFGRFKVPVAIDESLVKQSLDYNVVKDVMTTVEKDRKDKEETKQKEVVLNSEIKNKSNKSFKREKIRVVCASCGAYVKVNKEETICPKCDEPLKE